MPVEVNVSCLGVANSTYFIDEKGKVSQSADSMAAELMHNINIFKKTIEVKFSGVKDEKSLKNVVSLLKEKYSKRISKLSVVGEEFRIKEPILLSLKVQQIILCGPMIERLFGDEEPALFYAKLKEENWDIKRDRALIAQWNPQQGKEKENKTIEELGKDGKPRALPSPSKFLLLRPPTSQA